MFLPNIHHFSDWSKDDIDRVYVTLRLDTYGGGNVSVTAMLRDGVVDSKDIMVHLPQCSFTTSYSQSGMIVVT